MSDEGAGSPLEIKEIAERALRLQRYLLRRAWAVLYATFSASMFSTIFAAPVVFSLAPSAEYSLVGRFVVGMVASGAALTVTLWAFRRVRDTAEIRSILTDEKWKGVLHYRVLVPVWATVYAIFILTIFVLGLQADTLILLLSVYGVFWAFLFYAMNLSFPGKIPVEGVAALSSFGIAIAGSLIGYLSFGINAIYALLWAATIVIWGASAVYARRRPLPKMEDERSA